MNRIKELRIERGWNQADLAHALNITRPAVGHYETGKRSPDVNGILLLCEIFGCSSDYLLGRSEIRNLELTHDEAELLKGYRSITPEGQTVVKHVLAMAKISHSKKSGAVSDVENQT